MLVSKCTEMFVYSMLWLSGSITVTSVGEVTAVLCFRERKGLTVQLERLD